MLEILDLISGLGIFLSVLIRALIILNNTKRRLKNENDVIPNDYRDG